MERYEEHYAWDEELERCACQNGYRGPSCDLCVEEATEYCEQRDSNHECVSTGCCLGTVIENTTKADTCRTCVGSWTQLYCAQRDAYDNCEVSLCGEPSCTEQCVLWYENGVCRLSLCCPEGARPFRYEGDGTSWGHFTCCGNGTLTYDENGVGTCHCYTGYKGVPCNECADGYEVNADGNCVVSSGA